MLGDRLDSHDWDKISNVNVSPAARAGSAPVIEAMTCVVTQGLPTPLHSRAGPAVWITWGPPPARPAAWTETPLLWPVPHGQVCLSVCSSREAAARRRFASSGQNYEHPSINKQEWEEQEVTQLKAACGQARHLGLAETPRSWGEGHVKARGLPLQLLGGLLGPLEGS